MKQIHVCSIFPILVFMLVTVILYTENIHQKEIKETPNSTVVTTQTILSESNTNLK